MGREGKGGEVRGEDGGTAGGWVPEVGKPGYWLSGGRKLRSGQLVVWRS